MRHLFEGNIYYKIFEKKTALNRGRRSLEELRYSIKQASHFIEIVLCSARHQKTIAKPFRTVKKLESTENLGASFMLIIIVWFCSVPHVQSLVQSTTRSCTISETALVICMLIKAIHFNYSY